MLINGSSLTGPAQTCGIDLRQCLRRGAGASKMFSFAVKTAGGGTQQSALCLGRGVAYVCFPSL